MQLFFSSLKTAALGIWPLLKKQWPLLLTLHLLAFSTGQLFDHWQEQALAAGRENWSTLIPLFLASAFFEILLTCAWFVAVAAREPGFQALNRSLNATIIETMRAFASVLRWVPALVVPAFVKYLRYLFVPFIVITDDRYARGELDALHESQALSRGHLVVLFAAFIFEIALSLLLGQLVHGGNDSIFTNVRPALAWGGLTLFINLFTALFLFSIYRNLVKVRAC